MTTNPVRLSAVPLPGLRPDSPGNYFASLGLLRILARKWPIVRIAWYDHILHVVGEPINLGEILDELVSIAEKRTWSPYERQWMKEQKSGTKKKSGQPLANWQAEAEEHILELFAAHAVPHIRVSFNPMLGSGGNAGKRAFSDGWQQAVEALAPPKPKKPGRNETAVSQAAREAADRDNADAERKRKRDELESLLLGRPVTWLVEKLNAASWFSDANKLYNSGQNPFREGLVSPWSMALACEGLVFWAGGASRRIGARTQAHGAFPFISGATAPGVEGEAGRDKAEVWTPIWERPMTLPEARALFLRGRAEVRGRGVLTPSAFASAVVRRGVDAGISGFFRFALGRTTSANTFEPRFEGYYHVKNPVGETEVPKAGHVALERVLGLIERLPKDRKKGERWRFVGLRGPIEAAMLHLAAKPGDPEASCALLDAMVKALEKVDRNRSFREKGVSWEPLPIEWLPSLFGDDMPASEARLAMALVSAFPLSRPFATYRFGVEAKHRRFAHPKQKPPRWVWGPGELPRVLTKILLRRTLDWESSSKKGEQKEEPVSFLMPATASQVQEWLEGRVDEALLARWISRLALFDWRFVPGKVQKLVRRDSELGQAGPSLCLFGLFCPLFDLRPVRVSDRQERQDLLPVDSGARTPGAARTLANLIHNGQIEAALRLAAGRYSMAGIPLASLNVPWRVDDPDRLLASILFQIADYERTNLINRWLKPRRMKGENAHV